MTRARVHRLLSGNTSNRASRVATLLFVSLISLNVLAVIIESVEGIHRVYGPWLDAFEGFSVAVFAIEYLLRLWACTSQPAYERPIAGRFKFALTPMALIDLFAFLPALLTYGGVDLRTLRMIRLARILRIAKLGHYSKAMQLIAKVIRGKRYELTISLILMLVMLILSSSLMYLVEHDHQPEVFSSIPAAMWWSVCTLTTVGYGDVYPVTAIGKVLGALISIVGIGLFALPAGIIAAGFIENHAQQTQKTLRHCPNCGKSLDQNDGGDLSS